MHSHTLAHYRPPADNGLDIVYQDPWLIVVDKPAGLLSVPGRGKQRRDSLALRVQQRYPGAQVVHRLDMCTSGLMVMALDADIQRRLNTLFSERRVEKRYTAVVAGQPQSASGDIRLPLICDWPNRPRQKVDLEQGKPALTHYRVIDTGPPDRSRLELTPVTGRTHQLRVHMQAMGHAILGDRLYGDEAVQAMAPRLLLHASVLRFPHPVGDQPLCCESPAPF